MGYLLTEIVVYLVIAGLIGFSFGWLVRDGALDKYFDKLIGLFGKVKELWNAYYLTLTTSKKVVEEPKVEVKEIKEEVAPAKVAEVISEEIQIEESIVEEPKVEIAEETVTEIAKETSEVFTSEETSSPVLLKEAPKTGADKLSAIKGIGPVLEKKLNELGIYSFEQIASWDAEQEVWIGTQMAFPKRVTKEEWVKQAKELLKNK